VSKKYAENKWGCIPLLPERAVAIRVVARGPGPGLAEMCRGLTYKFSKNCFWKNYSSDTNAIANFWNIFLFNFKAKVEWTRAWHRVWTTCRQLLGCPCVVCPKCHCFLAFRKSEAPGGKSSHTTSHGTNRMQKQCIYCRSIYGRSSTCLPLHDNIILYNLANSTELLLLPVLQDAFLEHTCNCLKHFRTRSVFSCLVILGSLVGLMRWYVSFVCASVRPSVWLRAR